MKASAFDSPAKCRTGMQVKIFAIQNINLEQSEANYRADVIFDALVQVAASHTSRIRLVARI